MKTTLFLFLISLFAVSTQAQTVSLPFTTVNGMIVVSIRVNGARYEMLVDTGSDYTIIDQLDHIGPPVRGVDHGIEVQAQGVLAVIELSRSYFIKMPIAKANLAEFTKRFPGGTVNGVIGQDVMRLFSSVRIDYKAHTIELVR